MNICTEIREHLRFYLKVSLKTVDTVARRILLHFRLLYLMVFQTFVYYLISKPSL